MMMNIIKKNNSCVFSFTLAPFHGGCLKTASAFGKKLAVAISIVLNLSYHQSATRSRGIITSESPR